MNDLLKKYVEHKDGVVFRDRGAWATGQDYSEGDITEDGGSVWKCNTPHLSSSGNRPPSGNWTEWAARGIPGGTLAWEGLYNAGTEYDENDGCRSGKHAFYSLQDGNVGHTPPADGSSDSWWSCFAQGGDKGDQGDQGDKGDKGDKGDQGDQGDQGIQGVQGDPGITDGWVAAGETWTYASVDDPTFTFTISGDLTAKYYPGMRLKLTQTSIKYFIITKVAYSSPNTTITIYGGTDYNLANAAIADPYWSVTKCPAGFPLDPLKWTVETADTNETYQSTPTINVWYNPGSLGISVPIGSWRLRWRASVYNSRGAAGSVDYFGSLSTANNSESEKKLTVYQSDIQPTGANAYLESTQEADLFIALTSKTPYYLIVKTTTPSTSKLGFFGPDSTTLIQAICAYL